MSDNALARARPKPRGFRLNSADRINREYGPLQYDDPAAAATAEATRNAMLEQRGQPGVLSKLLIGGAANALEAAGLPGVFDPDGTMRSQTWGNALRASSWFPQDTVEGIGQAITAPARAYRGEIPDEEMISEGLNFAGNMAIGGSAVPKPNNAAGMFGGRLAKTADHAKLQQAEKMAAEGAPREAIWRDTGWFQGVDEKWRFEIDDSKAGALPSASVTLAGKSEHSVPIGERIVHPEYMSAYPDAAGLNVQPWSGKQRDGSSGRYYEGKGFPYDASDPDRGRSIALHELQHDAQFREGFARGGSPRGFTPEQIAAERSRLAAIPDDGWSSVSTYSSDVPDSQIANGLYKRLAGETEARAVQKRADLTPEQRASRPPWLDYDVPESQQIVGFNANASESAAPGALASEAARPVQMEVPFYRGSAHGQTSVDYSQPYFGTTDRNLASDYAKSRSGMYFNSDTTPNVTPAVARFRDPLYIDAQNAGWSDIPFEGQKWNSDKLAEVAKERGHDGLVIDRLYDEGRFDEAAGLPATVAALRPGTVSSAFDPNNILYANSKSSGVPGVVITQAGERKGTSAAAGHPSGFLEPNPPPAGRTEAGLPVQKLASDPLRQGQAPYTTIADDLLPSASFAPWTVDGYNISPAEAGSLRNSLAEQFIDGKVPDGWLVHGRSRRGDLDTGNVIQGSESPETAIFYAGNRGGSIWAMRPTSSANVLDFSGVNTPDIRKTAADALRSYRRGDLPFSDDLADLSTPEKSAALRNNFSPNDIVNSAQAFDNPDWLSWLRDARSPDFVKTPDGGVAFGPDGMQAVRLFANSKSSGVPGAMIAEAADKPRIQNPIRAYHGSPHDFDRFDLSKIGTGEGAQAYGHGLYFAENEGVAKSYRDALSTRAGSEDAAYMLSKHNGDKAAALAEAEKRLADSNGNWPAMEAAVRELRGEQAAGRMYEVALHADPNDFLDWDKPLSQQSEKVRTAMSQLIGAHDQRWSEYGFKAADEPGSSLYREVNEQAAEKAAGGPNANVSLSDSVRLINEAERNNMRVFREAGIPGIKYLDQGSRTAGEGSRNYVVFDDALIEILRKYMNPKTAAAPGVLMVEAGKDQP